MDKMATVRRIRKATWCTYTGSTVFSCIVIVVYVISRLDKDGKVSNYKEQVCQWQLINSDIFALNGNIFRVTGHLCGEFTGRRWIPRTKACDAELWFFFLICVWINGWENNREAGDLRRHRAHYDVIAMLYLLASKFHVLSSAFCNFTGPNDVIQDGRRNIVKSHGTSSVDIIHDCIYYITTLCIVHIPQM